MGGRGWLMTTTVMNVMLMGDDDVDDVADLCLCLRLGDFCRSVCRCATRHSAHDVPVDAGRTGSAWCVRPDLSYRDRPPGFLIQQHEFLVLANVDPRRRDWPQHLDHVVNPFFSFPGWATGGTTMSNHGEQPWCSTMMGNRVAND